MFATFIKTCVYPYSRNLICRQNEVQTSRQIHGNTPAKMTAADRSSTKRSACEMQSDFGGPRSCESKSRCRIVTAYA